jgi:hypothetical protein
MKKWIIAVAVVGAALLAPRFARAHEGHDHTVMGTIASIDGTNLMVKTADGKQTMVMMDAKTKITQGTTKVDVKALKVGDRVVATGAEQQGMISATTVKVGAAPAAPAKAAAAKK